jgi:hypothetical protein
MGASTMVQYRPYGLDNWNQNKQKVIKSPKQNYLERGLIRRVGVKFMSKKIRLVKNSEFKSRAEISSLLGGSLMKGITLASKVNAILLFTNEEELYDDYFYPKGTYDNCLYTGIGRYGHQDSLENKMYVLNIAVLSHKKNKRPLLVFEKRNHKYYFIGQYQLTETHQNVQPDNSDILRRVFVFHLKKISNIFESNLI